MNEVLHYVKNFFLDRQVASIAPTSKFAIERACRTMDFKNARLFVEYGPGNGCFTRYLLEHMSPDARLICFETNEGFVQQLRNEIRDPRLLILNESATGVGAALEAEGRSKADYILSGIPFSFLGPDLRRALLSDTASALADKGRFITYQVFPPAASFDKHLKKPMEEFFALERIEYEFRNLPPLRIYEARAKR